MDQQQSSRAGGGGETSRFTTLDAMRGVAALLVLGYHLGDAGWVGGAGYG